MRESIDLALSGVGSDLLRIEAGKYHKFDSYIEHLIYRHGNNRFIENLRETALFVEPEDKALGVEEELPAANTFFKGAMLGVRIAGHFLPPKIFDRMVDVEVYKPSEVSADPYQNKYNIAAGIMDTGTFGYNGAEAYHQLFEDLEDRFCPDVRLQPYIRAGFGLVMYMIREADQAEMAHALDHEIDFEAELAKLSKPQ